MNFPSLLAQATPNLINNSRLGSSSSQQISGFQPFTPLRDFNLSDLLNKAIAYAILIAFILSLVFMLWGGISFILSGGKEDKIKKALGTIRYAILGLIITILAASIVGFIGNLLGISILSDAIDPTAIFDNIRSILDSFGSASSGSRIGF